MSERTCRSCRHWRKYDGAGVAGSCRRRASVGAGDWPETTGADWCGEWEGVDVAKESVKDVVPCKKCGGDPVVVVVGDDRFFLKCRNACPNQTEWFNNEENARASWNGMNMYSPTLAEKMSGAHSRAYSVGVDSTGRYSVISALGTILMQIQPRELLELANDIVRRAESKM